MGGDGASYSSPRERSLVSMRLSLWAARMDTKVEEEEEELFLSVVVLFENGGEGDEDG